MGMPTWLIRKSNVGSIARSIATGWFHLKNSNPEWHFDEIIEQIITVRYSATSEFILLETVKSALSDHYIDTDDEIDSILKLTWIIFEIENKNEEEVLDQNGNKWKKIMREEIEKIGKQFSI